MAVAALAFMIIGFQAWVIPVNGEAVEVLSWRQGAVRVLKVLPTPLTSASRVDHYSLKRPIIALCDTAGPGPHFCSVSFISLKTGEQVIKTNIVYFQAFMIYIPLCLTFQCPLLE